MLNLDIATSNEWHLLKGEDKFGPYGYADILKMKQNNLIFDFDFVWSPHLEEWTQVSELAEFSQDRVTRLKEKSPESEVFQKRSSARVEVKIDTFVTDQHHLWAGQVESLSMGGALVRVPNPLLLPGQKITLHMRTTKGPVLVQTEITNKKMVKTKIKHDTHIAYVVKFMGLCEAKQSRLEEVLQAAALNTKTNLNSIL